MKVLSKKKVEALFDALMNLHLIGSESVKEQAIHQDIDVRTSLRRQRMMVHSAADAAYILKGFFGMRVLQLTHEKYNAEMLKRMEAEEAKKDTLGDVPPPQRYTEKIQVGDNVTDILQLPCVQSAHKRSGKDRKVAYYILEPSAMFDSEHWQYAHPGEWLVQDENGKWHVTKE